MQMRTFERIGKPVSLLGFGCMRFPVIGGDPAKIDMPKVEEMVDYAHQNGVNYYDTAYLYHGGKSEEAIGAALKNYPRESYYLTTKMPAWQPFVKSADDLQKVFDEQLRRCGVEYFDFYLMHSLDAARIEYAQSIRAYEFLRRKKDEGAIRHLGFSFHDTTAVLSRVVELHEWDFAQIQLNFMDWELLDAKGQYEVLRRAGLPVVVMEPLRGGALAKLSPPAAELLKEQAPEEPVASWGLRFAASLEGVMTVLSGMSEIGQVRENVRTMAEFAPLTDAERRTLNKALALYRQHGTIPCTGCAYCMPCPQGVEIPTNFALYNQYQIDKNFFQANRGYRWLEDGRAENCVGCGACEVHCPQSIGISKEMPQVAKFFAELKE